MPGLRDGLVEEQDRNGELSRRSSHMEMEGLGKSKEKKRKMYFGVEWSPDTIAIAMVYFVQGILGLSRLAVTFFLKDDLHLDPAEVSWLQDGLFHVSSVCMSIIPGFHHKSNVHSNCSYLGW